MSEFTCLICNNLINSIFNHIKTEGKCQLLCNVLQNTTGSFFDLSEFINLWTTGIESGSGLCPECDAKLVQLDHYLEQLSTIQASIERIQNEIREDSIKSQFARKTKHEPAADQQDYIEATEFLDGPLLSESDSFNYNDSNDKDFFDDQPIDELDSESEQVNDPETDHRNKTEHYDVLDREVKIILEPLNLPAGELTFNLKTDKEIINYIKRDQSFIKKSLGKGSVKKKKEKKQCKTKPKKYFFPFKCDVGGCKKGFTAINFLMAHKKGHPKNGGIYSCDYCDRVYKLRDSLATHLIQHGIGDSKKFKQYTCPSCPEKIFPSQYTLNRHAKRHENRNFKSIICEMCGEEVSGFKYKMEYHLQWKHGIGEDLVKCPKCPHDQFYKTGSKLYEIHMEHHQKLELKYGDQVVYNCEFCTFSFVIKKAYEEHKLRKHLNPDLKEKCSYEECNGLEFSSKHGLAKHIKDVHDGLIKCPYCNKQCRNSTRMRIHIKRHLGQKDYQCDFYGCEKGFFDPATLLDHKKTAHSAIKPFNCSYKSCSKAFFTKDRLKRHELLHSGVIRFVCEFCSEGYTMKESLRIHIQSKHKDPNTIIVGNNPRKQEYVRRPKVKVLQKSDEEII